MQRPGVLEEALLWRRRSLSLHRDPGRSGFAISRCVPGGRLAPHGDLEEVVLLAGQGEHGLAEGALDGAQGVVCRLFFLGAPLLRDDLAKPLGERFDGRSERLEGGIANHAGACRGGDAQEGRVDDALQVAVGPRAAVERIEARQRCHHAGAVAVQAHGIVSRRLVEVQLHVHVAVHGAHGRQFMQQPPGELARLHGELLARGAVHDPHPHTRLADALAQLGRQVPLDLLARKLADAGQQGPDLQARAGLGVEDAPADHRVARIPLAHAHLVGAPVGA